MMMSYGQEGVHLWGGTKRLQVPGMSHEQKGVHMRRAGLRGYHGLQFSRVCLTENLLILMGVGWESKTE